MYGHGAAPPTRSAATVITLRVLFAAAGFLSCGLLACVPLFRIAILRGRVVDWVLAWVSLPLSIVFLGVVGSLPDTDPRTDVAVVALIALGAVAAAYYLTVDIRYHNQLRQYPGYAPAQTTAPPFQTGSTPYGYPQPTSPYASTPVPQPGPHTPIPQTHPAPTPLQRPVVPDAAPPGPVPPAPAQQPGPARIDQVRAELDELSDYLRRQDGQHGDHHEGGR
ncbi:hypothetical protein ACFYOV_25555 [Streptomyces sp. NPDC005931]|uniref:hypothetical protein n=1 Tax=Streptomyces sp. NPDC005931 TaxID=3364737 RepID=UPI00368C76BC